MHALSRTLPRWLALVALLLSAVSLMPSQARACGGFFCSLANPVDQAGEQILFAVNGTEVTAYVQIQYQGSSQDFSWVLPLPTTPEFGLGSDAVFAALRQQTDPRFQIEWQQDENCRVFDQCGCWASEMDSAGGGPPQNTDDGVRDVDVLAEGSVGPFDYKVIQASEGSDGADVFAWLNDNGYDQPSSSQPLINQYAEDRFVFVVLKLQQDKSAGEIQPIVLKYNDPTLACIPLRLTAIAARPDMPIRAWVLSRARAIPMNYFHVVLNANAYDWFNCAVPSGDNFCGWWYGNSTTNCQQAYMDLVTRATDVVDGLGFVTEFAGSSEVMNDIIYSESRYNTEHLKTLTNAADFMREMLNQGFSSSPLLQEMFRTHIPKPADTLLPPDCQTDQNFYAVWNIDHCLQYMPSGWVFDPIAFADELQTRIVQPLIDGQTLFDNLPYLTRLFTTMSPDEMIRDPLFSFNPDLPDISNVHTVTAKALCDAGSTSEASRVQLTYEDGSVSIVPGRIDPLYCTFQPNTAPTTTSALAMVQVLDEEGAPKVIDHNDPQALADADGQIAGRRPSAGQSVIDQNANDNINNSGPFAIPRGTSEGDNCGCASLRLPASGGAALPVGVALALAAFGMVSGAVVAARRRRGA